MEDAAESISPSWLCEVLPDSNSNSVSNPNSISKYDSQFTLDMQTQIRPKVYIENATLNMHTLNMLHIFMQNANPKHVSRFIRRMQTQNISHVL